MSTERARGEKERERETEMDRQLARKKEFEGRAVVKFRGDYNTVCRGSYLSWLWLRVNYRKLALEIYLDSPPVRPIRIKRNIRNNSQNARCPITPEQLRWALITARHAHVSRDPTHSLFWRQGTTMSSQSGAGGWGWWRCSRSSPCDPPGGQLTASWPATSEGSPSPRRRRRSSWTLCIPGTWGWRRPGSYRSSARTATLWTHRNRFPLSLRNTPLPEHLAGLENCWHSFLDEKKWKL